MIVCQACGTENPDGTRFCQKCATRLDQATQVAVAERREAHTATAVRWPAVIGTAVVIAVILLVVLFALHVI